MRFADSNVLVYATSKHPDERWKARIAFALLQSDDLALSVQVLQEFYVQATRSGRPEALSHETAITLIGSWVRWPVQPMTVALMEAALATKQRYRISYWDAAIIEAARAMDCDIVLSEDLSDTQDYGGVRVLNPFKA
jgi:predicted nucleic acid-binding protein